MITWAIIFFVAVLAWDVIGDFKKWLNNKPINHRFEWMVRIALLMPSAITFANQLFYIKFTWALLWSYLMIGFVWWLLFDGLYNLLRGFGWWFNGSKDAIDEDSWLDRWLMTLYDWQEASVKIVPASAFIILYIHLHNL